MTNISIQNIAYAIQAVNSKIKEFEHLLTADILPDRADIQDLTFCYKWALEELKETCLEELKDTCNFPSYEELVKKNG